MLDDAAAPLEGVRIELVESGRVAVSDAAGRFVLRGLEPGRVTLAATRLGYAAAPLVLELENGRTTRVDVLLTPVPLVMAELRAEAARPAGVAEAVRIGRAEIEASGARSAGDVVRGVPGVVLRATSPGGPQTVSLRGGGEDALLVLVDGVVLNDPVTGEADLSTVPASAIESVSVLAGAQSARYGPRAQSGVVLIETRRALAGAAVSASAGSLGERGVGLEWGGHAPVGWGAGASWRALAGRYDFALPPEAGGGSGMRENADLEALTLWAGANPDWLGGRLSLRGGYERLERGLPGRGYAPTPEARQSMDRTRGSANFRRVDGTRSFAVTLAGVDQRVAFRDPAPPLGLPYDDTVLVRSVDLRAELDRVSPREGGPSFGLGVDSRWQGIEASTLADAPDGTRWDVGLFASGGAERAWGAGALSATAQFRADRDPLTRRWRLTHSLGLGARRGPFSWRLVHRSGYSPPALGDQFFRDAVGVEPNPDLRAERVPSEIELGMDVRGGAGPVRIEASATVYDGDVVDMIVWAPDFRFIWSPRNFDVQRRGAELRLELTAFERLRIGAWHAYGRVAYDRDGDDDVQVAYRPRHTAAVTAAWRGGRWGLDLEAAFTGERNTAPSRVNTLPGFWTLSARASRAWSLRGWRLDGALRVDRLRDEKATLIFGFPHPGRVIGIDLRVTRDASNALLQQRTEP